MIGQRKECVAGSLFASATRKWRNAADCHTRAARAAVSGCIDGMLSSTCRQSLTLV